MVDVRSRDDSGHGGHGVEHVLVQYGDVLERMAGAYTRSAADRDDLLQEIAIALWLALPRFRAESSIRTFVLSVARRRCSTYRTRVTRRLNREVPILEDGRTASLLAERPNIQERIETEERRAWIDSALDGIPQTLSIAVRLRLKGLSDREIGSVLGISQEAVAVRLHRARKSLRRTLEGTVANHTFP